MHESAITGSSRVARTVVVTGAAGGVGRGLAECFAADGDRVVIADLNGTAADAVADDLRAHGLQAIGAPLDVRDEDSAARMVERTVAEFGSIDVLVNNAGLFGDPQWTGRVLDLDLAQWDALFAVNVRGILVCARAVAPVMRRARAGRIVNVSSMAAYLPAGAYGATKLTVHHLTWSLAAELGADNITVNCVGPGTMDTQSMRRNSFDEKALQERINRFILKRVGTPKDVYGAIRYFASPEAEWCTGQVLLVNGGANVRL